MVIIMNKHLEIIVFHLGYGGIEQMVSNLANLLKEDIKISIVAFYKLYETPIFQIDPRISVTYLYNTDVPLKVKKYNQLLRKGKVFKMIATVFQDYKFHLFSLFHDFFLSCSIYFFGGRYRRLKKHLKQTKADVYLSTRHEISKILTQYGKEESFKIGWEHNHYHGDMDYKKAVVNHSQDLNRLVLVSRELTHDYQQDMNGMKCQCVYIPNMLSYDLPYISNCQEKRIVMVGRLEQEKGLFDAIDVMKRLQERMIPFHLDIVGDGPLRKDLEKYVCSKNLTSYVQFHGFQQRTFIEQLLVHSSVYLMTSFTESFGLVLLEAMNAGVPVIAFDSAEGAKELIQNDHNGYLIQNRDFNQMADRIIYLLNNPNVAMQLGKNGKEFSRNFLPVSVKAMWLSILRGE